MNAVWDRTRHRGPRESPGHEPNWHQRRAAGVDGCDAFLMRLHKTHRKAKPPHSSSALATLTQLYPPTARGWLGTLHDPVAQATTVGRSIARLRPGDRGPRALRMPSPAYAAELLTNAPSHVGYLLEDHLANSTVPGQRARPPGKCPSNASSTRAVVERLVTHPQAKGHWLR